MRFFGQFLSEMGLLMINLVGNSGYIKANSEGAKNRAGAHTSPDPCLLNLDPGDPAATAMGLLVVVLPIVLVVPALPAFATRRRQRHKLSPVAS